MTKIEIKKIIETYIEIYKTFGKSVADSWLDKELL